MDALLVPPVGTRVKDLLEGGLNQARRFEVAFSQKTSQLPEQPLFRKYSESAVNGVEESHPIELRELGHRCVCDVGPGVIVLDRYFFRSEKGSIDRIFQVLQFTSAEIGGEICPVGRSS